MPDRELVLRFLTFQEHSKGSSRRTVDKYFGYLQQLVTFLEARGLRLLDSDLGALEAFTGLHAHEQGMTPRSRRPLIAAVRGFYAWALRNGLVDKNPAAAIGYPKFGRPLPTALSLENAERLIMAPGVDTFIGIRDTAMLGILMGAGIRVSGLVRLNESHLRFHREGEQEHLVLRVEEKGKTERLVPVDDYVRLMVHAYLGHPQLNHVDRLLEDGDQVLFISVRNTLVPSHDFRGERRRLHPGSVGKMMRKYGKRLGIPVKQLHPHAARHLYGVSLAEDQTDILRIQSLMGHVNPKDSAQYVRLAVKLLGETVRKSAPTSKIQTPVTALVEELRKSQGRQQPST